MWPSFSDPMDRALPASKRLTLNFKNERAPGHAPAGLAGTAPAPARSRLYALLKLLEAAEFPTCVASVHHRERTCVL